MHKHMILKASSIWILFGAAMVLLASASFSSCSRNSGDFSKSELALIHGAAEGSEVPEGTMRVLTIDDPADCLVLRMPSHDLSSEALLSSDYEDLAQLMVATVTHPSQDGVGIAGPQVGLSRRVVAVQRFDKEPILCAGRLDHPFEVYPNIRIVWASDSLAAGPEGCLSVPDRRGDVLRSTEIVIEYADMVFTTAPTDCPGRSSFSQTSDNQNITINRLRHLPHATSDKNLSSKELHKTLPMVRDTLRGFTAVIFQHEIDHLEGVLYIDRL